MPIREDIRHDFREAISWPRVLRPSLNNVNFTILQWEALYFLCAAYISFSPYCTYRSLVLKAAAFFLKIKFLVLSSCVNVCFLCHACGWPPLNIHISLMFLWFDSSRPCFLRNAERCHFWFMAVQPQNTEPWHSFLRVCNCVLVFTACLDVGTSVERMQWPWVSQTCSSSTSNVKTQQTNAWMCADSSGMDACCVLKSGRRPARTGAVLRR